MPELTDHPAPEFVPGAAADFAPRDVPAAADTDGPMPELTEHPAPEFVPPPSDDESAPNPMPGASEGLTP